MSQSIPIPHNPRIPAKYSMAIASYNITDYTDFHDRILILADYYRSTDYDIVLIEFGMNRSWEEWKFYARIYMNDSQKPESDVGTIIPTLWNIVETEDILLLKRNYE